MPVELNYKAVLQKEGITVEELSDKTKRKIADYEATLKHPFSYKKGTQELTPKAKQKLDDLNEDIIEAIYDKVEEKAEIIEEEKIKAEEDRKAKEEEEQRKAQEATDAEKKAKEEAEKNKKKSFLDGFFGW